MARIIQFGPARATGAVPPAASVSFGVSPIDVERIHRIFDPRPDPFEQLRAYRPTFGDRLERFMRRHGDRIVLALVSFALGGLAFSALAYVLRAVL